LVQRVLWVHGEIRAIQVTPDLQVHRAKLAQQALKALRVPRVSQEFKVFKANPARRVFKASKV
jgi:hypothetical protein